MREQVLLARIRVPALPAHVRRVTGVSSLVAAEVRRRLERLVTRVALVGPLPRVAPPVRHQVVLGSKRLATEVAGEWPLPTVRHLVPGDVARVVAREGAVAAEEPALPCLVQLRVLLEGLPRGKEVVALLAAEAPAVVRGRRCAIRLGWGREAHVLIWSAATNRHSEGRLTHTGTKSLSSHFFIFFSYIFFKLNLFKFLRPEY